MDIIGGGGGAVLDDDVCLSVCSCVYVWVDVGVQK